MSRAAFIVSLLLVTLLGGCHREGASTSSAPGFTSVFMRRLGCLGSCPAYTVEILSNGAVRFDGASDVAVTGKHESHIPSSEVNFLSLALLRSGFYQMNDAYVSTIHGCIEVGTDQPSVVITVLNGSTKKQVGYSYGCKGLAIAKRIKWLSQTIDDVGGTVQWVGP